jgi:hypothetical protein
LKPTSATTLAACAASAISTASLAVRASGFSHKTCFARSERRDGDVVVEVGRGRDQDGIDVWSVQCLLPADRALLEAEAVPCGFGKFGRCLAHQARPPARDIGKVERNHVQGSRVRPGYGAAANDGQIQLRHS